MIAHYAYLQIIETYIQKHANVLPDIMMMVPQCVKNAIIRVLNVKEIVKKIAYHVAILSIIDK